MEDLSDEPAERRRARKFHSVAGEIDAGQHHFPAAALHQAVHLIQYRRDRQGARIAAAEWNDAEGAAMVTTVLHLHERAHPASKAINSHRGDFLDAREVAHINFRL